MHIRFDHPELLWLMLIGVPIVLLGMRSLATLEPVRRWTAMTIRLLVLLLLVLMLAGLQTVRYNDDLTVIVVADQSESVRRFAAPPPDFELPDTSDADASPIDRWLWHWVDRSAERKRADDRLGLITFDGKPAIRARPSVDVNLQRSVQRAPSEGTDVAGGMRLGMASFSSDTNRRMVLVWDGNDTIGSAAVLDAAREAAAAGIRVDVLPIEYRLDREVMVEGVYAPTDAREGQAVALRVVLRATRPTAGQIFISHDRETIDINGPAEGRGAPVAEQDWTLQSDEQAAGQYVCVRMITLPLSYAGVNRFTAVFDPAGGADQMAGNNEAEAFTLVQGRGRVLVVSNLDQTVADVLPAALQSRGVDVDVVSATAAPVTMNELQRYDAVVFQNVPADLISPRQQQVLRSYVEDIGGGFVMVGGPDSFGAGGWTNSIVDKMLPVECQIPSLSVLPSGALVIVMDRSGSMAMPVGGTNTTQQQLANEAAVQAISTLYPQDLVGVVGFDTQAHWIVRLQAYEDQRAVARAVQSIQPGGGTDMYPGLEAAFDALKPITMQDAAIRHVIVLSDGETLGRPFQLIIGRYRKEGITISTVGVGDAVNSQLLMQIAKDGGGQYYPVHDPRNLPRIFMKEAKTIRKNLIKEEPFIPQRTGAHSPVVADLGGLPELVGLVLTGEKKDARVTMPLISPEGEPLFAHWQVGLGRTAAFTSDANNRWARAWLNWGGYADFWSRTLRLVARPASSRDFDLITDIDQGKLRITLDASQIEDDDGGGSFQNFLNVQGALVKPDGSTQKITLAQTGPGLYEAQAPAEKRGSYIVSLIVDDGRGERRSVVGGTSQPPGDELRRFQSNRGMVEQVAQITGGRVLDPQLAMPGTLFVRDGSVRGERSMRPLWWPLLGWLIFIVLLDVACRRIAWDIGSMRAWAAGRARAVGDLMRTREVESGATLDALKRRAKQVDQSMAERSAVPQPSTKRKFEAAPQFEASDDFAQAVGGASETPTTSAEAQRARQAGRRDGEQGPATTSRLLDAKRRARERMGEKGDES